MSTWPGPGPRPQEVEISTDDTAGGAAPELAPEPEVPRPGRHPVLTGLWAGVTYGLLALVLLLAGLLIVVPKLAGGVPLTILSGSMEPNLPVGSLAVVVPVEPEDVRIGQIITYLPNPDDPTPVTHRVTAITHRADGGLTFTLQGDANAAADAPVQDFQVRARVLYAVPWLGYLNLAVNGDERSVAVYVVAGAFFLWALSLWWRAWRRRRAAVSVGAPDGAGGPPALGGP
ncbi:signal peptidase I [Cellulosimicrobium cellulans]|uniref:Signal peptidase I n=1 Tax=Cellulosimicrobium cellulans TaxID=1710 RepID=A0A1Y0HVD6_CELCE|nr:signal peptidase I [Cellulosimicrobium cellulans]ARU52039.1 signal peptidase I [Cellulosimicrobium cellulans]